MAQKNINHLLTEESGGLDLSTLILIGGGALLLVGGLFFQPVWIDPIFRAFDFRLWAWWYFIVLFFIVVFSIKWFLLFQSWDDLDPTDLEMGKRFLRMSIAITIESLILVLLKMTKLLNLLYYPLVRWFGYGDFSWMGGLAFLFICIAVVVTVYVVKEWFIAVTQL